MYLKCVYELVIVLNTHSQPASSSIKSQKAQHIMIELISKLFIFALSVSLSQSIGKTSSSDSIEIIEASPLSVDIYEAIESLKSSVGLLSKEISNLKQANQAVDRIDTDNQVSWLALGQEVCLRATIGCSGSAASEVYWQSL